MKTNNHYYKVIAKLLDESVDNQHHTDLYYSKRIAESYDNTYTDIGNLNKYLRDFAEDVGVELDNKHHTRLWYLKRIASKLYDGELEHNTENYYLRIISENIEPTPPTPTRPTTFNFKITNNGNPIVNKEVYDNNNSSVKYYTDSNGEIKDIPFPIKSKYGDYGEINYKNALTGTGVDTWMYGRIQFLTIVDGEYTQIRTGLGLSEDIPFKPFTFEITINNGSLTWKVVTDS